MRDNKLKFTTFKEVQQYFKSEVLPVVDVTITKGGAARGLGFLFFSLRTTDGSFTPPQLFATIGSEESLYERFKPFFQAVCELFSTPYPEALRLYFVESKQGTVYLCLGLPTGESLPLVTFERACEIVGLQLDDEGEVI